MSGDLSPVIAATARWLIRAYPAASGAFNAALAGIQARQATTAAAWLRYPTEMDAALVTLVGPGGSGRLDWVAGVHVPEPGSTGEAWRTWVDEVVASWAACLLTTPALAFAAVAELAGCEHAAGCPPELRRLTSPDERDRRAAPLLRHPDLLAPIAELHRPQLFQRLDVKIVKPA